MEGKGGSPKGVGARIRDALPSSDNENKITAPRSRHPFLLHDGILSPGGSKTRGQEVKGRAARSETLSLRLRRYSVSNLLTWTVDDNLPAPNSMDAVCRW